eukprot:g438.t1
MPDGDPRTDLVIVDDDSSDDENNAEDNDAKKEENEPKAEEKENSQDKTEDDSTEVKEDEKTEQEKEEQKSDAQPKQDYVVSDYAKTIDDFYKTKKPDLPEKKMDVEIFDVNTKKSVETFTIDNPSREKKVKVFQVDTTVSGFSMKDEDVTFDPKDFNICVMILDKTKPVNGFARVMLHLAVENCCFCLIFKPADKDKIKMTLSTILNRPEFLNNTMFIHMITFPRVQLFDVSFSEQEFNGYKKTITAVYFGTSSMSADGSACGKGRASVTTFMSRVHHFAGAGFEVPAMLSQPEKLPDFQTVMKCEEKDSNFAMTCQDFFEGVNFEDLPDDFPKEAFFNTEDLKSEFNQYLNAGEEEEEEEEEEKEEQEVHEEEEEKEKETSPPEAEEKSKELEVKEPTSIEEEKKESPKAKEAPARNQQKKKVITKKARGEDASKKKAYLHQPTKFKGKAQIFEMTLHDMQLTNIARAITLPKRYLSKGGSPQTSVILVIGNLDDVLSSGSAEEIDVVESQLHLGVARAAAKSDAVIIDSGLPTSIGAVVSEVKALPIFAVGISFVDSVDAAMLDPRYARTIHLTSSEDSEFEAKRVLSERLTGGCNVVCVLCGGSSEEHSSELNSALDLGWPVLALEDTGGFAAEVSKNTESYRGNRKGKLVGVPHLTSPSEIASCLHICMMIDI